VKVKYYGYMGGVGMGNLIWPGKYPMKAGKFPKDHPVGGAWEPGSGQYGDSESMAAFRSRGYWASCFPEGDGITFKPLREQSTEIAQQDAAECFGWTLKVERP
jgi:hypothetical protein